MFNTFLSFHFSKPESKKWLIDFIFFTFKSQNSIPTLCCFFLSQIKFTQMMIINPFASLEKCFESLTISKFSTSKEKNNENITRYGNWKLIEAARQPRDVTWAHGRKKTNIKYEVVEKSGSEQGQLGISEKLHEWLLSVGMENRSVEE